MQSLLLLELPYLREGVGGEEVLEQQRVAERVAEYSLWVTSSSSSDESKQRWAGTRRQVRQLV